MPVALVASARVCTFFALVVLSLLYMGDAWQQVLWGVVSITTILAVLGCSLVGGGGMMVVYRKATTVIYS